MESASNWSLRRCAGGVAKAEAGAVVGRGVVDGECFGVAGGMELGRLAGTRLAGAEAGAVVGLGVVGGECCGVVGGVGVPGEWSVSSSTSGFSRHSETGSTAASSSASASSSWSETHSESGSTPVSFVSAASKLSGAPQALASSPSRASAWRNAHRTAHKRARFRLFHEADCFHWAEPPEAQQGSSIIESGRQGKGE